MLLRFFFRLFSFSLRSSFFSLSWHPLGGVGLVLSCWPAQMLCLGELQEWLSFATEDSLGGLPLQSVLHALFELLEGRRAASQVPPRLPSTNPLVATEGSSSETPFRAPTEEGAAQTRSSASTPSLTLPPTPQHPLQSAASGSSGFEDVDTVHGSALFALRSFSSGTALGDASSERTFSAEAFGSEASEAFEVRRVRVLLLASG